MARFYIGSAVMTRYAGRFPLGTFLINVSGSFFIGLLMTLLTVLLYVPMLALAPPAGLTEAINYVFDTLLYSGAALLLASALTSQPLAPPPPQPRR